MNIENDIVKNKKAGNKVNACKFTFFYYSKLQQVLWKLEIRASYPLEGQLGGWYATPFQVWWQTPKICLFYSGVEVELIKGKWYSGSCSAVFNSSPNIRARTNYIGALLFFSPFLFSKNHTLQILDLQHKVWSRTIKISLCIPSHSPTPHFNPWFNLHIKESLSNLFQSLVKELSKRPSALTRLPASYTLIHFPTLQHTKN